MSKDSKRDELTFATGRVSRRLEERRERVYARMEKRVDSVLDSVSSLGGAAFAGVLGGTDLSKREIGNVPALGVVGGALAALEMFLSDRISQKGPGLGISFATSTVGGISNGLIAIAISDYKRKHGVILK